MLGQWVSHVATVSHHEGEGTPSVSPGPLQLPVRSVSVGERGKCTGLGKGTPTGL